MPNTSKYYSRIQEQWLALRTALQFLSWLPVGSLSLASSKVMGISVSYYPIVGLLLGAILGGTALFTGYIFNDWISAALLLSAWVWLTGALHLDGLADSADAWLGGLGSKSRTLSLMKDPTSGPIAIASMVLILLLKLTCLHALIVANHPWAIMWALIFARCNAVLLLMHTPYVRSQGLGNTLSEHLSRQQCYLIIAILSVISLAVLGSASLIILISSGIILYALRYLMLKRLNGCTGDTVGALIEISETLILLSLVACLVSP